MVVAAAAAVVVVVVVVRGGKLAFGAHTLSTYYAQHQGQAFWGQRACIGRVAQGQHGGGMRVLGVFENWAGKCLFDFDLKRPTATLVATHSTQTDRDRRL